jgi:predicted peroxiredoxin
MPSSPLVKARLLAREPPIDKTHEAVGQLKLNQITKGDLTMAEKMIVVCNHAEPGSVMPALIFASSGIALDYEVHMFFCPGAAQALVKGELEKIGTPKGMPNPVNLFNTIMDEKGKVVFCELAIENKGINPKDLRDKRIVVEKVPPFLMGASGAGMTFVF